MCLQAKRLAREAEAGASGPRAILAQAEAEQSEDSDADGGPTFDGPPELQRADAEQYEGTLSSDDDIATARPEAAHAGMQRRAPIQAHDGSGAGGLSLPEQEALALRLLPQI